MRMMKEKCRSDKANVKRLGVVLLHLVFSARAPRRVSVTKMPCLSGAEVETWGNLSEVEDSTTRPASPGPAAGDGCASAAGLETFAEAMLDTKTNGGPHAKKMHEQENNKRNIQGIELAEGGARRRKRIRKKRRVKGRERADLGSEIPAQFWGALRSLSLLACAERY